MRIGYGVVTINRPGGFIHPMLGSLDRSGFTGDLMLSCGTDDASHLAPYRTGRYMIREMPRKEMEKFRFDAITRGARCSLGHYWCMRGLLERPENYAAVALFEDDVIFPTGWEKRLEAILGDVRTKLGDRWIMSLYLPDYCVGWYYGKGDLWFEANKKTFFGSQAILYPREIAEEFMSTTLLAFIDAGKRATDMAVAEFCSEKDIPLVVTTPCLVQHIGSISVGCNPDAVHFHKAGFYRDPI